MSTSKEQEIKQTQETELETELAEEAEETVLSGLESLGAAAEAVEEAEDNEDDFDIPQRFTKSGRKRAVPFPLKVSNTFFKSGNIVATESLRLPES
jgi:hypothetical protein